MLSQQTPLNVGTTALYNKLRHKFVCADNITGYIKRIADGCTRNLIKLLLNLFEMSYKAVDTQWSSGEMIFLPVGEQLNKML